MPSELERTQKEMRNVSDERSHRERNLIPCYVRAVEAYDRVVWLETMTQGDMISRPCALPFDSVFRIPTPDSNYAILHTGDDRHTGGIPILYDRRFIEPRDFISCDPESEHG